MFLKKYSKLIHRSIYTKQIRYQFMGQNKFDSKKDYYKILNVNKDSSDNQIKMAFYKLAKIYHPDHNKGQENKFKQINQAYQILSDKSLRQQYDQSRVFGSFTENLGNRAKQGNYHYRQYTGVYQEMSKQEQEMLRQQMNVLMRKFMLFGLGLILFSIVFLRRPNQYYNEVNGDLIPVANMYGGYPTQYSGQPAGIAPYGGSSLGVQPAPYPYSNPNLNPGYGGYGYPNRPQPTAYQTPYQGQYIQPQFSPQNSVYQRYQSSQPPINTRMQSNYKPADL